MTNLPIGLLIEGLVAVLLVITIGYCWTLNRRLKRLRADEEILRATISELMTATEIAERAILGLKTTAADADRTLGKRLKDAESMSNSLSRNIDEGEQVFMRISQIAEAARQATNQRDAVRTADSYAMAQAPSHSYPPIAAGENEISAPRRRRTDEIKSAAEEAKARLDMFRRKSEGAAA